MTLQKGDSAKQKLVYTRFGLEVWNSEGANGLMQRYGTVTIFYGSNFDFWKIMVPVPVPTFEKLRFRFRVQLG